jgi:uncharacterized protein YicC (UPF0701 family)
MSDGGGYPVEELVMFLRSYKDKLGSELANLSGILDLQTALQFQTKRRWFAWYTALASRMGDDLKVFRDMLKQLGEQNREIGTDTRKNISSVIDKISALLSKIPQAGGA